MNCPLCGGNETKVLESVDSKELMKQYKSLTGEGFGYLLERDIEYRECEKCKLRYFDPLITGDEKFYNSLQKFDWYYPDEKEEFLEAAKFISSSDRVLEIGSGRGAFVKYLPTQKYVGLDFSENAREMARKDGILIKNEMVQDYVKRNEGGFDIVVSFQVLEHVSNPKSFIEAKVKALVSGGKMIIIVPSEDSFLKYASNNILNMPPHHVTRWTDDTLTFIADKYNLDLVELRHEKLQDVHKLWFIQTLISSGLFKPSLLKKSLIVKAVIRMLSPFSKMVVKGLKSEMLSIGHTIMAVYKKK